MVRYLKISDKTYPYRFTALRYYQFYEGNDASPKACMDLIYDCIVAGSDAIGEEPPSKELILGDVDLHEVDGLIREISSTPKTEGKKKPAKP